MDPKQEEFNRLYQLLSNLSAKQQVCSTNGIVPMISLNDIISPSANPTTPPYLPASSYSIPSSVQDILDGKNEVIKDTSKDVIDRPSYQCVACLKTYAVQSSFDMHVETSIACKRWKELPPDQQTNKPHKAMHEMVSDWLEEAIGCPTCIQCQFCKATFASRGNHHKHYQTAIACNRLAYLEFKRIIANLT